MVYLNGRRDLNAKLNFKCDHYFNGMGSNSTIQSPVLHSHTHGHVNNVVKVGGSLDKMMTLLSRLR